MREKTKIRIYQTVVTAVIVLALIVIIGVATNAQEPIVVEGDQPYHRLVVDGTAIGTVKPGTLDYDFDENVIRVESNELVYGCQQAVIFRDRFQQ